jgi:thymidylate synthase
VNGIIEGAYGPRLFKMRGKVDQLANVRKLLLAKPNSRRAVVQLFNAEDIESNHKEIPCTTTLQFHLREKRLSVLREKRLSVIKTFGTDWAVN